MVQKHIVAIGGGGFSMEDSPLLDDYILGLAGAAEPKICFVGTASGDSDNYTRRFYQRFSRESCRPTHLSLFKRTDPDLVAFAKSQDIIYVGGGSAANMLLIWRHHGFDEALRAAYESGTILAGVSAGSLCWFEWGVTDSYGPELQPLECLGLLPGSHCPYYDNPNRNKSYHQMIEGGMPAGYGADVGAALHFVDGTLDRVVTSRPDAKAYSVSLENVSVVAKPLTTKYLR